MLTRMRLILPLAMILLMIGCDDRATRVALHSVDQQVRQNLAIAKANEQVANGTTTLLAADGDARREILAAHRQLLAASDELTAQRNELERERRHLAALRRGESLLVPLAQSTGGVLLIATVLGFCWYALVSVRMPAEHSAALEEFLIAELTGDARTFRAVASPNEIEPRIAIGDARE